MPCYIVSESHLPRNPSHHYNFCTDKEIATEKGYNANLQISDKEIAAEKEDNASFQSISKVISNSLIQYTKFMGGKISGVSRMNQFKEALKQGKATMAHKHFAMGISQDLFMFFTIISLDTALNKQNDNSLEHRLAFAIAASTSTFFTRQYYVQHFHPDIKNIATARSISGQITAGHLGGFALGFAIHEVIKQLYPLPSPKNVTTGYHFLDTAYVGYKIYAIDSGVTGISDVVKALFIPAPYQFTVAMVERVIDPLAFNIMWDYAVMPGYINAETINIVGVALQISVPAISTFIAGEAILPVVASTVAVNALGALAFVGIMLVTEYAVEPAINCAFSPECRNSVYSTISNCLKQVIPDNATVSGEISDLGPSYPHCKFG